MKKTNFPLSEVYRLLEPGPVVLLTTARAGRANVMPMSWHLMMEFEPPLVGCVVSNRNYSFASLKAARECVINILTVELAETVLNFCFQFSEFQFFKKLTRHGNGRGRFITRAKASSWWRAGRSICLRQKRRLPENKWPPVNAMTVLSGNPGAPIFKGAADDSTSS